MTDVVSVKTKIHRTPEDAVQDVCCPGFSSTRTIPHPHRTHNSAVELRLGNVVQIESLYGGKIRPCGRGSCGIKRVKSVSKNEKCYDSISQKLVAVEYLDVLPSGEYADTSTKVYQKTDSSILLPCQDNQSVAASNSRVAAGLTKRGRERIEDGCFLLERKFGITNLGFYTLTLNLHTRDEVQAFNDVAALCLKRFLEKIKRLYERRRCRFSYVGVWEIHPARTARSGFPVLHFHYIAPCYKEGSKEYVVSSSEVRSLWSGCVRRYTGCQFERDCRVGTETCRTNPGGYLAKYFSKGVVGADVPGGGGGHVGLSSWFSLSRNLLDCINSCTSGLGTVLSEAIVGDIHRGIQSNYFSIAGVVEKDIGGKPCILGYWFVASSWLHGMFSQDYDSCLQEFLCL
jgi:hypothetical protein